MPRDYPHDISKQSFLTEMYDKEKTAQLKAWYIEKTSDTGRIESQPKSRQYQVFSRRIEAACPRPTPALASLRQRKQQDMSSADGAQTVHDTNEEESKFRSSVVTLPPITTSDMIEPDLPTKLQIYNGTTREGRLTYLRSRHHRRPESRYAFPLVSSWEYGWRLGDVIKTENLRNPPHGRNRIIAETFYRHNGLPELSSV